MIMKKISPCFHFNESGWLLLSDKKTKEWLKDLSLIMGLKECAEEHSNKIIIYRDDSRIQKISDIILTCREIDNKLPEKNWSVRRIYSVYILTHPESSVSIFHYGHRTDDSYSKKMFLLYPVYDHVISSGGLPIHGGLIRKDSSGFILAGKSTSGKSTCCSKLTHPYEVLCDDLSLIVKDKNENYSVYPLPTWSRVREKKSESFWKTTEKIPLKKLFFLEKSDRDEVTPISTREGAMKIFYSSLQVYNMEGMKKEEITEKKRILFESAWDIALNIPCYNLRVSIDGYFWKHLE